MLIDIPSTERERSASEADPPAELTAELAWCLKRFVTGRADEPAMRRAAQALELSRAVEAVSRAGALGLDEPDTLDVAQHARRPTGRLRRLMDGERAFHCSPV